MNGNKTIAKNTIIVYSQLFVTIILNLIISRLVLQTLGASDFGLYSVVGGIVGMFTFISASMAVTTTRFLNYEMGKPDGNLNKIFNQSNVLHICIAIIILILLETIGLYYIYNYLNVPFGKESDALFVFQVSTIVACVGIINVPYQAIFVAHEKFNFVALIDISNVTIKLFVILALLYSNDGNKLRLYAIGMSSTTFFSFIIYHILSKRCWPEIIKWKFVRNWRLYKDELLYSNWNLLATASIIGRSQGSAIIINYFFGTTVNAAYAIADMVQQQVNGFIGRFDIAVSPQITQNLGAGNISRSVYLASNTCRLCILGMEILFFTLYSELDSILRLWLGEVPEGALVFTKYTLLIALVSSTSGGLVQFINGSGKIKWFKIQSSLWNLCPLVLGFILYRNGMRSYGIVILFVIADVFNRAFQLLLLKRLMNFDIIKYIKESYFRPFVVLVLMMMIINAYSNYVYGCINYMIGLFSMLVVSSIVVYYIGLQSNERKKISRIAVSGVNKICKRI